MKHLTILLTILFALPLQTFAQRPASRIRYGATLPAVCNELAGDVFFRTVTTIGIHACTAANTWTFSSGGLTSTTGVNDRIAVYTSASNIEGDADLTFNTTTNLLSVTSGNIAVGTTPALSGAVRISNGTSISARNNGNSGDLEMITINASDQINIGGVTASTRVILSPGTQDIQWAKALVALGGGAAPTLGTIGGSGPATAAQNTWLRLLDSTGAASWIPVWK